jgi:hypothetical protein
MQGGNQRSIKLKKRLSAGSNKKPAIIRLGAVL